MRVERLGAAHHLDAFNCGNQSLTAWLRDHARAAEGHGTATWVAVDEDRVVGHYSLSPHSIDRASTPRGVARGRPQQIPAVLLAKLAVDIDAQYRGLGRELLVDALLRVAYATFEVGGLLIVVDAIDENAEAFYKHHGFIPGEEPGRLFMPVKDALRSFSE